MDKKPTTSQAPAISVTLGRDEKVAQRRKDELDRIAKVYKVKRSTLLQMIADGKLDVVPARREQTA
jgi:hypothetical protein